MLRHTIFTSSPSYTVNTFLDPKITVRRYVNLTESFHLDRLNNNFDFNLLNWPMRERH